MKPKDARFIRSAGLVSALTLISRLLGLVREGVCAHYFGAGQVFDAFVIAFRIPNLSRRLFGEGAMSAAFIPVLTENLRQDLPAARHLAGSVIILLSAVLVGLVVVGELAILIARQFFADSLTLSLTAIMLPYMVFICLVAVLAGAHNVLGRFGAPALMPILFNIILIGGVLLGQELAPQDDIRQIQILSATVLFAGLVQLVLQWTTLSRTGFRPVLTWSPSTPDIRRITRTLAPMLIGMSAVQLNSLADLLVAWVFVDDAGAASVLSYGERLYQLPLGLCGIAIGTAIFPRLTELSQEKDASEFADTLQLGLRLAIFVGLPASLGLWTIRTEAVQVIFEHGVFGPDDSARAASVVGWYSLAVWAYILQHVYTRGYYALGHHRTPMRIASIMVLVNLTLNLILVQYFNESGVAAATALTATIQVSVLASRFDALGRPLVWKPIRSCAFKALLASAMMVLVLLLTRHWLGPGTRPATLLCVSVVLGAGLYVMATIVLRSPEISWLREMLRSRRR